MLNEINEIIDEAIDLINNGEYRKARSVMAYLKIKVKETIVQSNVCPVCFGDKYLLNLDLVMRPCPACDGTGKNV